MSADAPVGMTLTNPALKAPIIEVGVPAALDIVLTNSTGADIGIRSNPPSTLVIFGRPAPCFVASDLQAMSIELPGWSLSVDTKLLTLVLKASADATWADKTSIGFTIKNARTQAKADPKTLQINMSQMTGPVPLNVSAPLILKDPPKPGNASLTDVLQVSLDNQGTIFRSKSGDPLSNKLFLNIKNLGDAPLFSGTGTSGKPVVSVTFVYGGTAGALAPDTLEGGVAPEGSAWNIVANPKVSPLAWATTNPNLVTGTGPPAWLLTPSSQQILGTGDKANVTFEFKDIISFTQLGHTQMYLLFTGFMKNDTTPYDSHVFVLDIVKQDPPLSRGLLAFYATDPIVELHKPGEGAKLDLRWTMFGDVARVQLTASTPAIKPAPRDYPNPEPLAYDATSVALPAMDKSGPVVLTLQSYDRNKGFLNALQFTVSVRVTFVRDKTGRAYAIAGFGDTLWMSENFAYAAKGSLDYGLPKNDAQFGRLYEWEAAASHAPEGWSLPTADDWAALIARFSDAHAAYGQLIGGGASGFNASLGGLAEDSGTLRDTYLRGVYWTAKAGVTTQFLGESKTVLGGVTLPDSYAASVRYVCRA